MKTVDGLITKESVLKDVEECVESAVTRGLCNINKDEPTIICIDRALRFGLKDPEEGYWHLIQGHSHATTLQALNDCLGVGVTPVQKGIAWLCFSLVEGSLISCLGSLLLDARALCRYYDGDALLRDKRLSSLFLLYIHQLSSVILLLPTVDRMADAEHQHQDEDSHKESKSSKFIKKSLAAVEHVTYTKNGYAEAANKTNRNRHCLDLRQCNLSEDDGLVNIINQPADYHQPAAELMTSSVQSLLSPLDSGVSLIGSDVDNTSVSDFTLENCKSEDDLLFTSMEDSGIIWGDSAMLDTDVASSCTTKIYNENSSKSDFLIVNNNTSHNNNVCGNLEEFRSFEIMNHESSTNNQSTELIEEQLSNVGVEKAEKSLKSNCDEIVFRRTKGRKSKKDKFKQVSFHESDVNSTTEGFNSLKTDNDCSEDGPLDRKCYSWCVENLAAYTTGKEKNTNGENYLKSQALTYENESSATLSDSEVGVEVDCDSSSTLEEDLSIRGNRKLYDKWTTTLKQLGLRKFNRNTREPEIFYESTSSLNSSVATRHDESSTEKMLKRKQHSIGQMLKSIKGQLMPVTEGSLLEQRKELLQCFSPSMCNLNDRRLLARSGSTLEWSSDSEWSSEVDEKTTGYRLKKRFLSANQRKPCRSLFPSKLLQEASSKTSLVNRFLQSIPETKPAKVHLALNRKRLPLFIKGVKCDAELNKQILDEISLEMENYKPEQRMSSVYVDDSLTKAIRTYTLQSPEERIYKVYQVSSLEGLPLLCVLSDKTLYLTGISPINRGFCNHHVVQYSQLSSIIVGPNSQVMMLAAVDKCQRVTVLATLGPLMVSDLLGHLELAVRRALGNSPLSIRQLDLSEMSALKHLVVKQSPVQKDEELEHYVWVNIGNANVVAASTPLGPTKSGHLMFRPHKRSQWLPGYCLLKAGVLYIFADANQRLPNHAVPLHSGQCCGCRRVPTPTRPHTFEILLPTPGHTFQLAAADDYEVSDWLQAFVQAASGDSGTDVIQDELAEAISGCGLLVTTKHILTLSFPHKVLSCVQLQNLSSVKLTYNCCILETGCKEMDEGGGDWIVYFATDAALEEFLDCLVRLQSSLAQSVVMMSDSDPLNSRCEQTSRLLDECWELLLHPQLIS